MEHPDTLLRRILWWAACGTLLAVLLLAGIAMAGPAH